MKNTQEEKEVEIITKKTENYKDEALILWIALVISIFISGLSLVIPELKIHGYITIIVINIIFWFAAAQQTTKNYYIKEK